MSDAAVLAALEFRPEAAFTFLLYLAAVFVLAILSHRLLKGRSFLQEYFLGSRGLGVWALAMSYAATSASGGSFTGFPALIYQHGWILALWIASYMVVPICCMALLGKRLNQVGRLTGAITVPDVFRDRFQSPAAGILASLIMALCLAINLVAQFKAGALILEQLFGSLEIFRSLGERLEWMPALLPLGGASPGGPYLLALLLFAFSVVAYTTYGGFRAVVWTDVLQGVVMFFGVLILLGFTLHANGGLEPANSNLANEHPAALSLEVRVSEPTVIPRGGIRVEARLRDGVESWIFASTNSVSLAPAKDASGRSIPARLSVALRLEREATSPPVALAFDEIVLDDRSELETIAPTAEWTFTDFRHDPAQNAVSGPGFDAAREDGFLPFGLIVSFWILWAISGAGQPTTMIRLMAFQDTRVYRRSILAVSLYYTMIYIPLVITFICARSLLPDLERPDAAMPTLVLSVVPALLAGLIMAAPFAAVMSTVDSFLLAISSCLVRDVYQRSFRPDASEATLRRLSYWTTLIVGAVVLVAAVRPPRFLQTIIVLTSAGIASSFLFPMVFALYWRRMNATGCLAGLLGGFAASFGLYIAGHQDGPVEPAGLHPIVWGLAASAIGCVLGSLLTKPSPAPLTARFFERRRPPGKSPASDSLRGEDLSTNPGETG